MTYVVLVILIALWAMVLLPPYLKDRRASGRTFRPGQSGGLGGMNSAQRFLPLQQASSRYSTSAVSSPTGMRTSGTSSTGLSNMASAAHRRSSVSSSGQPGYGNLRGGAVQGITSRDNRSNQVHHGNVVHLRPVEDLHAGENRAPVATSAAAYLEEAPATDEALLHRALDHAGSPGLGMPHSTAAARERRRHVLIGLTGVAVVTLLLALFAGGRWVAAHVLVDAVMVGYVILLVRHRQLMADRLLKVEPIRPPVNEQPPASVQLAPSYLLDSKTGS